MDKKELQLRYRSYGLIKHFLIGFIFLLGCVLPAFAGPAVPILISLAISAAVTTAQFLVTYLTRPKPKPQDKNKFQGEITLSNVGEDLFIPEIYGARGVDGFGGQRVGVIFFHASEIRDVPTEITNGGSNSGGGKGGGGGNNNSSKAVEHHYFIDLACMVAYGETRILEIKAGTDVIYRGFGVGAPGVVPLQFKYEAETATRGGGASIISDAAFSGGSGVALGASGTLSFQVTGDGSPHAFYLYYKADGDKQITVAVGGEPQTITLPDSLGAVASVHFVGKTDNGSTVVFVEAGADGILIDKLELGAKYSTGNPPGGDINPDIDYDPRFGGISGTIDPIYVNPTPFYGPDDLPDPTAKDLRPVTQYNYQANPNNLGEIGRDSLISLPGGGQLRIYEGSDTQLPDPLLQEFYEAKYGAGSTPAFRNRCYFVLENFEITKYGSVPNITATCESVSRTTLGAMYAHRSRRAGLAPEEYDYTALDEIPLRGYAVTQRQAPRAEMEILNRILDVGVYENSDGVIAGTIPTDEVSIQIPFTDLDVSEGAEQTEKPVAVETVVRNEYELPKQLDISFFDPTKDFEIGSVHALREVTVSEKKENIETGLVLTDDEAQKIADRLHQKEWAESMGETFNTFYNYAWLQPYDLVEVEDLTGADNAVRILARNGSIPGKMEFVGVSRNLPEPFPRIFTAAASAPHLPPTVVLPPNAVGTLIDVAILRTTETVPGVYAGCAATDPAYRFEGATLFWQRETGYQPLASFDRQATFGKTLTTSAGTLADVPGGWTAGTWDDTSTVTFDLYHGEVETRNDAEVLDRYNIIVIGNEVLAFGVAARVNGFPNRWTVSRLRRRLKGTSSTHAAGERVLLLTDAVKFIPLDVSEYDKTRNYKFVSVGQDVATASGFEFTWSGVTKFNTAANQTTDSAAPVLSPAPPTINKVGSDWVIKFQKPIQYGYSASLLEYRFVDLTNTKSLVTSVTTGTTSLTINNTTFMASSGKIVIGTETIGYGNITSGTNLNRLERGAEHSTAGSYAPGVVVKFVARQSQLGDVLQLITPQLANDYAVQYRWRNGYRLNNSDGWSAWSAAATALGTGSIAQPPAETPPPAPLDEPPPPPGYEDPQDPFWLREPIV